MQLLLLLQVELLAAAIEAAEKKAKEYTEAVSATADYVSLISEDNDDLAKVEYLKWIQFIVWLYL